MPELHARCFGWHALPIIPPPAAAVMRAVDRTRASGVLTLRQQLHGALLRLKALVGVIRQQVARPRRRLRLGLLRWHLGLDARTPPLRPPPDVCARSSCVGSANVQAELHGLSGVTGRWQQRMGHGAAARQRRTKKLGVSGVPQLLC